MSTVETHGLPHVVNLSKGYPYMITSNIDLEDSLVNGVIGTLVHIEVIDNPGQYELMPEPSNSDESDSIQSPHFRVWLQFENENIGRKARIKYRPHVIANSNTLKLEWTPLNESTGTISLNKSIKCKRTQLPLVPACAITIHKAQGGTFDEIVFQYDASQNTQLVYVALSRVTKLEGLYLTNAKNDFSFYHGRRESSATQKNIRDEYERSKRHHLKTLSHNAKKFCESPDSDQSSNEKTQTDTPQPIIIVSMNVQSLAAHTDDISTDSILQTAEYLVCSETWISDNEPSTKIRGFICKSRQNIMTRT
ncbi:unnamed protein product [Diatraea saccharalis]|uniref:UvrD-like helicase C-terminal domain-containing protein n=1 Tax=Diatraea saccharalis TaxID=40085 RepID=A0A9N9QZR2_9NEOP|nr:unnamed protein product [Diatraea saccharalis]